MPRKILRRRPVAKYELHATCDSSGVAYACSVYLRVLYEDGTIDVKFLFGKSRTKSMKESTIPKLELLAMQRVQGV